MLPLDIQIIQWRIRMVILQSLGTVRVRMLPLDIQMIIQERIRMVILAELGHCQL
jgi:hypothetical protein